MKTFFVILHIVCLNNDNWNHFSAQEPNKKKSLKNYYCYSFSEVHNVKCSFQTSNIIKVFRVQTNLDILDLSCNLI